MATKLQHSGHSIVGPDGRLLAKFPAGPMAILRNVFCFEMTFALFLFGGIYKLDPRFSWMPGDATAMFFVISAAVGLWSLGNQIFREGGLYKAGVIAFLGALSFVIWATISSAWTPSEVYARSKLTNMTVVFLWCTIATAIIIASSRERVQRFFNIVLVFGSLAALDTIVASLIATGYFKPEFYLSLGRMFGLAAVISFVFWLQSPSLKLKGLLLFLAFIINCYALLIAGGRAPTAALILPIMLLPFLYIHISPGQFRIGRKLFPIIALMILLAGAVTYLFLSTEFDMRTINRFLVLFTETGGQSASERYQFWEYAILFWIDRPITGQGIGAFPILFFSVDVQRYPHNLVLELLCEFGLIGFILFGAFVYAYVRRVSLKSMRTDPLVLCAVLLCINSLINAMSTGDLADNRNLIAVMGLLAVRQLSETKRR
jgi:O-antigen ligase